jgi:hypothetical protein
MLRALGNFAPRHLLDRRLDNGSFFERRPTETAVPDVKDIKRQLRVTEVR